MHSCIHAFIYSYIRVLSYSSINSLTRSHFLSSFLCICRSYFFSVFAVFFPCPATESPPHAATNSPNQPATHSPTQPATHSPTQPATHSPLYSVRFASRICLYSTKDACVGCHARTFSTKRVLMTTSDREAQQNAPSAAWINHQRTKK